MSLLDHQEVLGGRPIHDEPWSLFYHLNTRIIILNISILLYRRKSFAPSAF